MDDDNQLARARLEEEMFHVAEQNVNLATAVITVAKTILMNLHLTCDTLAVKTRPNVNIIKIDEFPILGLLASQIQI